MYFCDLHTSQLNINPFIFRENAKKLVESCRQGPGIWESCRKCLEKRDYIDKIVATEHGWVLKILQLEETWDGEESINQRYRETACITATWTKESNIIEFRTGYVYESRKRVDSDSGDFYVGRSQTLWDGSEDYASEWYFYETIFSAELFSGRKRICSTRQTYTGTGYADRTDSGCRTGILWRWKRMADLYQQFRSGAVTCLLQMGWRFRGMVSFDRRWDT